MLLRIEELGLAMNGCVIVWWMAYISGDYTRTDNKGPFRKADREQTPSMGFTYHFHWTHQGGYHILLRDLWFYVDLCHWCPSILNCLACFFFRSLQNPRYNFWSHAFTRCAPEIEKLFESVARSCMGPPIKSVEDDLASSIAAEGLKA